MPRRAGKPKGLNTTIGVRFSDKELSLIDEKCDEHNLYRAEFVRQAVQKSLHK